MATRSIRFALGSAACCLVWAGMAAAVSAAPAVQAADPPPSTAAITQLVVVSGATCALHADGAVSCWGRALDGPSGDPPIHPRPVGVTTFGSGVEQLASVASGICARYGDRTVKCLGSSAAARALEPQPLTDVVDLRGTCARRAAGQVACFRDGAWTSIAGIDDAIDADGNSKQGCAIHKDTTVSCWSTSDHVPQLVPGVHRAVQVAAGMWFACARLRDGLVSCWGSNTDGELGRGSIAADDTAQRAAPVVGVTDAVDLQAGAADACVLRGKIGTLVCWGELPWEHARHARPVVVPTLDHLRAFAGHTHACAVRGARDVWCMGRDVEGELGNGMSAIERAAIEVPGIADAIQVMAVGSGTCAVRAGGSVTCWGAAPPVVTLRDLQHLSVSTAIFVGDRLTGLDRQGRLWVDSETQPRPVPIGTASSSSCVIAKGGEVWCSGFLIGGRTAGHPITGQLQGVTDAVEISGAQGMLVRHRSGAVSAFTRDGAIGGGSATPIPEISDAIAIASGAVDCVVRANHTVWCWGDATSPLLGHPPTAADDPLGTPPTWTRPAQIPGIADAVAVGVGDMAGLHWDGSHICVVEVDGGVACWGDNADGQLGDGTRRRSYGPVAVLNVHDAVQVVVGARHACALEKSGKIACWGSNEEGAVGAVPTRRIDRPVRVQWP